MKNKKINKNVFENILLATIIMAYFIIINIIYYKIPKENTLLVLKILSMIELTIDIVLIEIAYRKESGKIAINSIEILVLAAHTLSVAHVVEFQKIGFISYIIISASIFAIYYIVKAIWMYTKEKKQYLNSLSDIKEIVTNTPTKKEATKK